MQVKNTKYLREKRGAGKSRPPNLLTSARHSFKLGLDPLRILAPP
jgi:hypothetical protein